VWFDVDLWTCVWCSVLTCFYLDSMFHLSVSKSQWNDGGEKNKDWNKLLCTFVWSNNKRPSLEENKGNAHFAIWHSTRIPFEVRERDSRLLSCPFNNPHKVMSELNMWPIAICNFHANGKRGWPRVFDCMLCPFVYLIIDVLVHKWIVKMTNKTLNCLMSVVDSANSVMYIRKQIFEW